MLKNSKNAGNFRGDEKFFAIKIFLNFFLILLESPISYYSQHSPDPVIGPRRIFFFFA